MQEFNEFQKFFKRIFMTSQYKISPDKLLNNDWRQLLNQSDMVMNESIWPPIMISIRVVACEKMMANKRSIKYYWKRKMPLDRDIPDTTLLDERMSLKRKLLY